MILPFSIPSPDYDIQIIEIGMPWGGAIRIAMYALCIIVGVIAAAIWTGRRMTQRGGERGVVIDFMVWSLVLGIIGARLYHVATHWGDYLVPGRGLGETLFDVIAFWNGGIAIFGALLGGALGVLIASRITGVRFLSFADALVPGLLLAQAFGRLGNWFNHELFGGPTTLPWGLEIEAGNAAFPIGLPVDTLFHPTFLYEIVWNLLGIVVLLAIERSWRPRWGAFFGLYLVWYGIGRACIESLRVDPSLLILGLRTNVFTALLAILLGIVLILVQRRRHPGLEPGIYLPGRFNPQDAVLEQTRDPELYYQVLDHGDAPRDDDEATDEHDEEEATDEHDAERVEAEEQR